MVVFIRNDMRSRVVQHNIELFKKGARLKFAACIVHFHDGQKKNAIHRHVHPSLKYELISYVVK